MNDFLITSYFYPIKEGGTEKFFNGIYFDNPRTETEISSVADFLEQVNFSTDTPFPEEQNQVDTDTVTLRWALKEFYKNNKTDKLVQEYYKTAKNDNSIYTAFARMWVIVRCDKILDSEAPQKTFLLKVVSSKDESENTTTIPPNSFFNYDYIDRYFSFISFMTNAATTVNSSILFQQNNIYEYPHYYLELFPTLLTVCFAGKSTRKHSLAPLTTFDYLYKSYLPVIEKTTNKYDDEKFLFICDLIKNISNLSGQNAKMYLLGIVSIIEMLLTHNPDGKMYNIEDSISKQYVRKIKYLIYKHDNSTDMEHLEKELKLSYSIRSDIAHGNFGKSSKENLRKLFDFYKLKSGGTGIDYCDDNTALLMLNENLTEYARIILRTYLSNETELNLIKDL